MEGNRTRIRRKNRGIKTMALIAMIICAILLIFVKLIIPGITTASRYAYTIVKSYFLATNEFYFNSDKLSPTKAEFEFDNWAGTDPTEFSFTINTKNNASEMTKVKVDYELSYNCQLYDKNDRQILAFDSSNQNVIVNDYFTFDITDLNKLRNGKINNTIYSKYDTAHPGTNDQTITITIDPTGKTGTLNTGDYVIINVKAEAVDPFTQTIEGRFKIIVGSLGMSYAIDDEAYQPYLNVVITNTKNYYVFDEAYTTAAGVQYAVGEVINIPEYLEELEANSTIASKTHSLKVKLDFDPIKYKLDSTSDVYMNASNPRTSNNLTTNEIGPNNSTKQITVEYINSVTFEMEAEESKVVRFYKADATLNNSYPDFTVIPCITVNDLDV